MNTLEAQLFRLPDLGEGLTEAEVLVWKVAVGDTVAVDQIVVEVETAKAAVEVPVPYAGTVLELHAPAGTTLSVGDPLISISPGGGADPAAERYREEEQAGSGNVLIGYGTGHLAGRRRRRRGRTAAGAAHGAALSAVPHADAQPAGPAAVPRGGADRGGAPRVISPLVRRLAQENGLDLARITPSGPNRVILRKDVERAIAEAGARVPEPRPSTPAAAPAAPQGAPAASPQEPERIPLRGLRRAVAEKLSRSRSEIPDATTWVDVDATGLLEIKDALRAAVPDRRIGLLALLARICVAGLRRYPELNSTVDLERAEIVRYPEIHLGFAAQTERGLVVPVVHDAHRMTLTELAAELARLTALAREGTLPPKALTGGTFTLNNYGVFGVDGSTPIINHPEAALLGVGRIIDRPWVLDGTLAVRKVTQLSFTFDHRVCDGGVAGGFLRYVADCVERPATLLADL
ncbi:Dihydrolipoamide acyltransferase component of branched-chain alpha-keto acid dehydrogenase complex [[Actinomadura] parvosata subsp. kistnae]|uniref:Dihydrolipoamide acetyltransferase component of pyruvate dehydrogenase complex n=1 Tax=[Actinomadura] parvosata subsp. kistnae TaxID=1909395 RepID=A0A1U9ZTT2_9ACTN|nr:dihydrolipoamide acetyltransferase family protein [Nonomuraea sp. ATCC 55076]AQZ61329.1 branched-chain alpha-keto acid dehydrogenase subunit E2 [Nonomuraea sp. ATCC 55076]SPL97987.1 Dihydrolipoamide acyltransferase component of branched-chain alpha-keto acid dehydrogenase complex [Actinomadura parvosata subsp. kistnae]